MARLPMWGGANISYMTTVGEGNNLPPTIPIWRTWLGDHPLDLPFVVRNTQDDANRTLASFPKAVR